MNHFNRALRRIANLTQLKIIFDNFQISFNMSNLPTIRCYSQVSVRADFIPVPDAYLPTLHILSCTVSWLWLPLLAPTGALYMMMCYYIIYSIYPARPLFEILIIYAFPMFNVPMFQCSNDPMFQCSDVPIFHSSNVPMFQCYNVPMFQCSNVQMFQCSNVQMFKCSNVQR